MKEIKFKNGKFTIVDDDDYDYLMQFTWHCGLYVTRPNWLLEGLILHKPNRIRMHREIMKCTDPNLEVDHINHNRLDNRKCNLRICTSGENTSNRNPWKDKTSKYLGVHFDGRYWRAAIGKHGKKYYLGTYQSEIEAALAYNKAASEIHGEFANLNVVQYG